MPGSCFGVPNFARLGFGGHGQDLRDGLNRLEHFLILLKG